MGKGRSTAEIDWHQVLGPVLDKSHLSASELPELQNAIERYSPRSIRLHPNRRNDPLPFAVAPIPWFDAGFWLVDNHCRPGGFLHYGAGDFYIQDAGSMLALALCDVQPGQWVCDTCASPGGKSTGILELLGDTGVLVSNEVIRSRLEVLTLALARAGTPNYLVTNLEVESLAETCGASFDCVVVDAPCTGQSMISRGKQSLAAYSQRQIEHSAARQQRIMQSAAELVKPGGRLVYSTCTFSFAENEAIAAWFLAENKAWVPIEDPKLERWRSSLHPGCYRLWPHRDQCSGAFAAAFKLSEDACDRMPSASYSHSSDRFEPVDVTANQLPWFRWPYDETTWQLHRVGDQLHHVDESLPRSWLRTSYAGVPVAEVRGRDWSPCYASSVIQFPAIRQNNLVQLNNAQACEFLNGGVVRCEDESVLKSDFQSESNAKLRCDDQAKDPWFVATWRGRSLGWGKLVQGTLKNHLPKALRKPSLRAE